MRLKCFNSQLIFIFKKIELFRFNSANKQKKNLILPLSSYKVDLSMTNYLYNYNIMQIKPNLTFLLLTLIFFACSSGENALTVGEDIVNDNHDAYYTEEFEFATETMMASYVQTNNTGVALCGSYEDEYLGIITANTVFKVAPNKSFTENTQKTDPIFSDKSARFQSLELVLYSNGYLYGDSTKEVTLAVHKVTEDYELISRRQLMSNSSLTYDILTNNDYTPYDSTEILGDTTFIPEYMDGDSICIRLSDVLGQEWFDNIVAGEDDYVIDATSEDSDEKFIQNVLAGITVRAMGDNGAILGFNMPTSSDDTEADNTVTLRMNYETAGPATDHSFKFALYDVDHQYNQITADFTGTALEGLVPGGNGISSHNTNHMTFVHEGLGLMSHVEIPTIYELGVVFGHNLNIINFDLELEAVTSSFSKGHTLPSAFNVDKFQSNGIISSNSLTDLSGNDVSLYAIKADDTDATYSLPLTYYAMLEQTIVIPESSDHTTLLISAVSSLYNLSVDRMVIGSGDHITNTMTGKMYYTTFE